VFNLREAVKVLALWVVCAGLWLEGPSFGRGCLLGRSHGLEAMVFATQRLGKDAQKAVVFLVHSSKANACEDALQYIPGIHALIACEGPTCMCLTACEHPQREFT
jgi:hypothetical protein